MPLLPPQRLVPSCLVAALLSVATGCFDPPPPEPVDVNLSERPCRPTVDNEACFTENGATHSVRCNSKSLLWEFEQFCVSGACSETPDPASPSKKHASCKSGGPVDAGTTEAAKKDVQPKTDTESADAVNHPCGAPCLAGMACDAKTGNCVDTCASLLCEPNEFCATGPSPAACKPVVCTLPKMWNPTVHKVSALALSGSATGCDLDDDGTQDNVLGKVVELNKDANLVYSNQISTGLLVMLIESDPAVGKAAAQRWLRGQSDDTQPACNQTSATANCKYLVRKESYVLGVPGLCAAAVTFSAEVTGTTMEAKSAGPLPLAIYPGVELALAARNLKLSGKVGADGLALTQGQLCGTIAQSELDAAVKLIPDAALQGASRDAVQKLLALYLVPDIDSDGNGSKDSISFAYTLTTVPAVITGVAK